MARISLNVTCMLLSLTSYVVTSANETYIMAMWREVCWTVVGSALRSAVSRDCFPVQGSEGLLVELSYGIGLWLRLRKILYASIEYH